MRELFFDILDEKQVAALAAGFRAVADKLSMNPASGCANARAEMAAGNVPVPRPTARIGRR